MKENSHRAIVSRYVIYLLATGIATAGFWLRSDGLSAVTSIVALIVMAMIAEAMPVQLPRMRGTVSVGFAIIHASALLFSPLIAAWIAAAGTLRRRELDLQVPWQTMLFNKGQLGLAAATSSWVFRLLGGDLSNYGQGQTIMAAVLSGLVYLLLNVTAVTLYLSVKHGKRVSSVWLTNIKWAFPNSMALLPISFLMAATHQVMGIVAPIFFMLPLLVARYSFQRFIDLQTQYIATIRSLAAALEAKDPHTYGHADRVSQLAMAVGEKMGLPAPEIDKLQVAGILHDIGKIGIGDHLLQKTSAFTKEEFYDMQRHPEIGARIVENIDMLYDVADWVRHHHERFDGKGYPNGLSGRDIPVGARIIGAVDAFDAIMSIRPYKLEQSADEALAELHRCSGQQFDPDVVAALAAVAADRDRLAQLLTNENRFADHLLAAFDPENSRAAAAAAHDQSAQKTRGGPPARHHPATGGDGPNRLSERVR
ncbi:MAG: HD-GYP domain-containing protein [Thermaerobacterales bacterium]